MPALSVVVSEPRELALAFALMLIDGFTHAPQLIGEPSVRFAGRALVPFQKRPDATFLFFNQPPGNYTVDVREGQNSGRAPYYQPVDIPIVLPMPHPLWPAFPDVTLADADKPLDDPTQPEAYRAQRTAATLQPTTAYPFPAGATLIRGRVAVGAAPVAGARVRRVGDALEYSTEADGEFVLFFLRPKGSGDTVVLRASHAAHGDVDRQVKLVRGTTVSTTIQLAP